MIFLTVGTQFPFDRFVRSVDELVGRGAITETVFAQIGNSKYVPRNFEWVRSLDKLKFDETLRAASAVLSHAGMGSITMSFESGKPLLVMPRMARYREVVNDHQVGIARKYAEQGLLLAAMDEGELAARIEQLKTFVPKKRVHQADKVAARIGGFLDALAGKGRQD